MPVAGPGGWQGASREGPGAHGELSELRDHDCYPGVWAQNSGSWSGRCCLGSAPFPGRVPMVHGLTTVSRALEGT